MNATPIHSIGFALLISLGVVSFCYSQPPVQAEQEKTNKAAELVARGAELDRKGEHAKSLELYTNAIRLDDTHANAYFRRGLLYLSTRQLEKALADSEKLVKLSPRLGHAYWLRGAVHGSGGKLDKAFADYNHAIRLNPKLAQAYAGRAVVHQSRGELHKALRDFDEAVRLEPRDPNLRMLRATLQAQLSQKTAPAIDGQLNVSNTSGRSIYPVVRAGREGGVHIVWMDNTPGNFEIFYSKWSGTKWSKSVNVSNNSTLSAYPSMAIDSKGRVHVTWMDGESSDEMDVFHSQLVDSKWSKPTNVSNMKGTSQRPQIEVDKSEVVHVVWYDNHGKFFELYHCHLTDGKWSEPTNTGLVDWYITHNPGWSRKPAITRDHRGAIHVVWVGMEEVPSPYSLCQNIRHSRWDGNVWVKPGNASKRQTMEGNLEDPVVVSDAGGNLHLSWEDRGVVWYCQFDGKRWSKAMQLNQANRKSALPAMCAAKKGRLHIAWLGKEGGKSQVFYRHFNGKDWSKSINASKSPGSALGCSLAVDNSNRLHMVWMDNRSGEYEIVHSVSPGVIVGKSEGR